jgi:hypothetical protein
MLMEYIYEKDNALQSMFFADTNFVCSSSLVYFGWPYLAMLVHCCFSVFVFIRSSTTVTVKELQALTANQGSADDVVMFSQQIKPFVLECENNLSAILSAHDDALASLNQAFKALKNVYITYFRSDCFEVKSIPRSNRRITRYGNSLGSHFE